MSDAPAPATYPIGTIARLLDLTERQIYNLAARGVLPRAERGRYEIATVVRAYIKYLRERTVEGDAKSGEFLGSRTRLLTARARKAEAEVELLAGTLLARDDVETAWSMIIINIRARFLALPSSVGPALHRAKTLRELVSILKGAVDDALTEIANTAIYAQPVAEGIAGAVGDDAIGAAAAGATAESHAVAMG